MSVGADWIAGGPQGHYPQTVQLSGDEWAVLQAYANRPPQTTTEIVDALEAAANELWSIPMASTRVLDQVRAALRKVRP
jgi:predicted phage gp36 major capsid-like protein